MKRLQRKKTMGKVLSGKQRERERESGCQCYSGDSDAGDVTAQDLLSLRGFILSRRLLWAHLISCWA